MAEDSGELVSGTVSWFSVIKGYGARRGGRGCRACLWPLPRPDAAARRLHHAHRRRRRCVRAPGAACSAAAGRRASARASSRCGAACRLLVLTARGCLAPQSDLHSEGFRSLREGEEVQFSMGLTAEGAPPGKSSALPWRRFAGRLAPGGPRPAHRTADLRCLSRRCLAGKPKAANVTGPAGAFVLVRMRLQATLCAPARPGCALGGASVAWDRSVVGRGARSVQRVLRARLQL